MLATMTIYTFVMGEISNLVMSGDEALVHMRQGVAIVQSFVLVWSLVDCSSCSYCRDAAECIPGQWNDTGLWLIAAVLFHA